MLISNLQHEDDVEDQESLVHDPSGQRERRDDDNRESYQSDHTLQVSSKQIRLETQKTLAVVKTMLPGPCLPSPFTQYEIVWIQAKRKQTLPAARCR